MIQNCWPRVTIGVSATRIALLAFLVASWPASANAGVNAWSTTGPLGSVNYIATDPVVEGRVFASTASSLYRSTNGGENWSRVASGPRVGIAFDPSNPEVLFASSGTLSLHRSADGGVTWMADVPVPNGFDPTFSGRVTTGRIAKAPGPGGALYATFGGGALMRTVDLGKSWTFLGQADDFALDASFPGLVYAVDAYVTAAAPRPIVRRSFDGGDTWGASERGLPDGFRPYDIDIDRRDSGRVYVLGSLDFCNSEKPLPVLFTSGDRGESWDERMLPAETGCYARIATDQRHGGSLLLGNGSRAWRSGNGGLSWTELQPTMGDRIWSVAPGAAGSDLYVTGAIDGVQWSTDNGRTWVRRNAGLPGALVRIMSAGEGSLSTAMSAAANYRFGGTGRWLDFGSEADTPASPQILGVERGGNGVLALAGGSPAARRARSGGGWLGPWEPLGVPVTSPLLRLDRLTGAPSSVLHWVASGAGFIGARSNYAYSGFITSDDGGRTWVNRQRLDSGPQESLLPRSIGAVAIDPRSPRTLWVGAGSLFFGGALGLVVSTDFGATWSQVTGWAGGNSIVAIDIDPADSRNMIVAQEGTGIWRTVDGGKNFARIDQGFPAGASLRTVAVDWAIAPAAIYAGTDAGVVLGSGNGAWAPMPLPGNVAVNALQLARPPGVTLRTTLVAGTDEGVYEYTLDPGRRLVPVFRLYNRDFDAHFYTAVAAERDFVLAHYPQFANEGIAFWALGEPDNGTIPVHRFFDTVRGTHVYTADPDERDRLLAKVPALTYEGVAYFGFTTSEPGTVAAYRFVHSANGATLYTASWDEALAVMLHETRFVFAGEAIAVYPAAARAQ